MINKHSQSAFDDAFISLSKTTSQDTLTVKIDASSEFAQAKTYDVKLVARLIDYYPEVAQSESDFQVVIKAAPVVE